MATPTPAPRPRSATSNPVVRMVFALNVGLYRATRGRIGSRLGPFDILLLTTTGRRTGKPRTQPLTYLREGDALVVIASNGGSPRHPAWYLNLGANPRARVQVRAETMEMVAAVATPEERAAIWPRLVTRHPNYADYQRATTREIPLVLLRPAE